MGEEWIQEAAMTAATRGAHHVGLTVRDVAKARDFFVDALGWREVGGKPEYPAIFVSDGSLMVTLWQSADARDFDRRAGVGLHHLALRVPTSEGLDALHAALRARDDVTVEFAPEPLGTSEARHMMLAGPSGVRLELIWVPE